ncbi:unnamed protein product [Closterium sp. Yama58-4]|nr:unnamed protein product [Closterium sp. Yama58-4]
MSLVSSISPLPPLLFCPPIQTTLWRPAPLKCPSIRVLGIATSFSQDVTREAATRNARGLVGSLCKIPSFPVHSSRTPRRACCSGRHSTALNRTNPSKSLPCDGRMRAVNCQERWHTLAFLLAVSEGDGSPATGIAADVACISILGPGQAFASAEALLGLTRCFTPPLRTSTYSSLS